MMPHLHSEWRKETTMTFIPQRDANDCGFASLSMIAKYYDTNYTIEKLRAGFHLEKEGISLLQISKVAETIGFKTLGGFLKFSSLSSKQILPCIVHWNQNHFVVIYKIKKHSNGKYSIYVADPAKGLVTYTKEEFCEHWASTQTHGEGTGIALLLEPTEQFYTQCERFIRHFA